MTTPTTQCIVKISYIHHMKINNALLFCRKFVMTESFYKYFLLQIYLNLPKFIFQFSLDIRIVEVPNIVVDKVGLELENGVPVLSVFKSL